MTQTLNQLSTLTQMQMMKKPKVSKLYLKNKFLQAVKRQVYSDKRDAIIAVCGGTGTGKSTLALWLAEYFDRGARGTPRFGVERVVFGFNEWKKVLEKKHPPGTVIVMEEPQAYFNSRTFQSKGNLDAVVKFSTLRVFRYIYILTYPSFARIDSQLRERIHFLITMQDIDKTRKESHWIPFRLMENWKAGEPPMAVPFTRSNGFMETRVLGTSPLPSMGLLEQYEAKSLDWKTAVKEGRISQEGSLISEDTPLINKREKQHEDMRTRATNRIEAEARRLWAFRDKFMISPGVFSPVKIAQVAGFSAGTAYRYLPTFKSLWEASVLNAEKLETIALENQRV